MEYHGSAQFCTKAVEGIYCLNIADLCDEKCTITRSVEKLTGESVNE